MINYKGQVTIWVILAIVLVISIGIFLFTESRVREVGESSIDEVNPNSFMGGCVEDVTQEVVEIILPRGGFIQPAISLSYNDINVSYLCYTSGSYVPCINQHPVLYTEISKEIEDYVKPRVEKCFEDYKNELERRKTSVNLGLTEQFNTTIYPGTIKISLVKKIILEKDGNNLNYENFEFEIKSPLYELIRVAMEIASQEAKYCNFENVGYGIIYPEFRVDVFPMSTGSKIYTILYKKSGEKMNIAIRSCVIPPGI